MSESIVYAGQLELGKCNLTLLSTKATVDITALVYDFEMYEDIMSPFMSGVMTIVDTFNLPTNMPIVGEEMIELEWKTPSLETWRKKNFFIYKLSNKVTQSDKKMAYSLHLISMEAYYDLNQRVSSVFAGKPHDIANEVYKKYLMTPEDKLAYPNYVLSGSKYTSTNDIKFISNYWSPSKIITYASSLATYTSTAGGVDIPNYVFFEGNRDFYFIPIDYMMGQDPVYEYIFDQNPGANDKGMDLDRQMMTVQNFEVLETFDYLKRTASGALSHQVFEFNLLNKRWSGQGTRISDKENKTWWNGPRSSANDPRQGAYDLGGYYYQNNYWVDADATNHTDSGNKEAPAGSDYKYGLLQGKHISWNDVNAKVSTKITNTAMFNGIIDDSAYVLAKRQSLLAQTEMVKVRITVFGRSDIEVGDCIKVYVPAYEQLGTMDNKAPEDKQIFDEYWTGKYLITNIRHLMTGKDHMMTLDLCRDAVSTSLNYTMPQGQI